MKKQSILLALALAGLPNAVVLSVPAAETTDNQLTSSEKKDGWILLFDGKTLDLVDFLEDSYGTLPEHRRNPL